MAEQNSFTGANMVFPNVGIHSLLAEIVQIRQQLTPRNELYTKSGWSDAMSVYLSTSLNQLRDTIENITYNPETTPLSDLEKEAADTTRSVQDDYNKQALASDNLLMPNSVPDTLVWTLDGSNVDLPQMTIANCPNDWFRIFIKGLDGLFVQATRLDSRNERNLITKYEGSMMVNMLNELFTIVQRKGGEANRGAIAVGTLPSQESQTFNGGIPSTSPTVKTATPVVAK